MSDITIVHLPTISVGYEELWLHKVPANRRKEARAYVRTELRHSFATALDHWPDTEQPPADPVGQQKLADLQHALDEAGQGRGDDWQRLLNEYVDVEIKRAGHVWTHDVAGELIAECYYVDGIWRRLHKWPVLLAAERFVVRSQDPLFSCPILIRMTYTLTFAGERVMTKGLPLDCP